ncbi:MAG: type II secretion system protein GspN [Myxococcales bacterium]|nr:type II secretion system protein GspN [Myxococcales bacterium]
MAKTESILIAPLPKSLAKFGIPIAAFLLTTFFILLDFPYHHLTNRITAGAGQALGVEIEAANSGLTFGLDGIGFRFEDVRVETPIGDVYDLDFARFGAGWSTSWFFATPTVFFEVDSSFGHARGTIRMDADASGSGSIAGARIGELSFLDELLPVEITGTLDAEGNIETTDDVAQGGLSFDLKDGSISHPGMPIEVPFETIHGLFVFGGEQFLSVEAFDLLGPVLNFSASGTVGHGEAIGDRALDLDIEFKDVAPQMRSMIELLGVSVKRDGRAKLHIGGSISQPEM